MAAGHTGRGTEMENKDHALCAAVGAQIRGPPKAGETETSASRPTLGIRTVPGWAVDGERGGGMRRHRPALWGWSGPPCMGKGHGGSLQGGRSHRAGWARLWGGAQTGTSRDHRVVGLGGALQGGLCAQSLLPQQGLDVAWGAGGERAQFCDHLNPGIAKLGW